jgi:uncharacterized OB-fold protein
MAANVGKPVPIPTHETRPYWEGCKQHELRIQRCVACGHNQFFPRIYCTNCFSDRVEWVKASGRATVLSFTIVRRPPSPRLGGTGVWSRVDLNSQTPFSSARRQLIVKFIVCELNFPLKSPFPVARSTGSETCS